MEESFNLEYLLDQINEDNLNPVGSVFKLLLSMTLGAAIGLERRHKGQIAGMRTFALISMGATLAMLVSIYIPEKLMGQTETLVVSRHKSSRASVFWVLEPSSR